MSAPYDDATGWRTPKLNTPEEPEQPCSICGASTSHLADCDLELGPAWFVFICPDCYAARTSAPTHPGPHLP